MSRHLIKLSLNHCLLPLYILPIIIRINTILNGLSNTSSLKRRIFFSLLVDICRGYSFQSLEATSYNVILIFLCGRIILELSHK
jgi:hypothetical protein